MAFVRVLTALCRDPGIGPHVVPIVADEARDLPQADSILAPLGALAHESEALFGPVPHFGSYRFLLVISDEAPRLGLEHRESSLNSAKADAFRDIDWVDNGLGYLLPHEFVHAWVGKFRRPVGMVSGDFHTTLNTEGLWVYEGLAQYLELAEHPDSLSLEGWQITDAGLAHLAEQGSPAAPCGAARTAGVPSAAAGRR